MAEAHAEMCCRVRARAWKERLQGKTGAASRRFRRGVRWPTIDNIVRSLVGARDVTRHQLIGQIHGGVEVRKRDGRVVRGLHLKTAVVNGVAVDPRRRACEKMAVMDREGSRSTGVSHSADGVNSAPDPFRGKGNTVTLGWRFTHLSSTAAIQTPVFPV